MFQKIYDRFQVGEGLVSSRERIRYAHDFINKSSVKIIKYGLSKSFGGRCKPLPYRFLDISVTYASTSNFYIKVNAVAVRRHSSFLDFAEKIWYNTSKETTYENGETK